MSQEAIDALRSELAAAPDDAAWRDRAVRLLVELADAFEDDDVEELLGQIVVRLRADREVLLAALDTAALEMHARFASRSVSRVRRTAAQLVYDDLTRWLPLAIDHAATAIDDRGEEDAAEAVDELFERTRHDRALAYGFRRDLAARLIAVFCRKPAALQLRAALEVAGTPDERLATATSLSQLLAGEGEAERDAGRDLLAATVAGGDGATPDVLAAAHLQLAWLGTDGVGHARLALAVARAPALRERATVGLAEQLLATGELAEAEALVAALPMPDDPEELGTRALLEDIRRRCGIAPDPVPDVDDSAPPAPEAGLVLFYTFPSDLPAGIRDGHVVTDMAIREWSHGTVSCEADLESEKIFGPRTSWWCGCGRYRGIIYVGYVCQRCGVEVISRKVRQARAGHVRLPHNVIHPWYAPALAQLLDVTPAELAATPIDKLEGRLVYFDLASLEDELADALERRPGERKARALEARLAVVRALLAANLQPRRLLFDILPVPPPEATVEPFATDRAAVRRAFVWLLEGHDEPAHAVAALFGWFRRRA